MLLLTLIGCTVYDAALLPIPRDTCGDGQVDPDEFCDVAIEPGAPGACPKRCLDTNPCAPKHLAGTGCNRRCVATPVTVAIDGDGCCLGNLEMAEDSDCGFCGDGRMGPGETCDPPETCQTEQHCRPPNSCITTSYSGSPDTCDARCVPSLIDACSSRDGCCPANCNATNDSDCSERCGDGRVDKDAGETCEPTNTKAPCPSTCDDGDDCTSDLQLGSPSNCNVTCSHEPISAPANGDGCCPKDETTASDSDCETSCDGGAGDSESACSADASAADASAQDTTQQCLGILGTTSNATDAACGECGCRACSAFMLQCYASGDAGRDAKCISTFECTLQNRCFNNSCYCGSSLSCANPSGPCEQEFEAAASTPSPTAVARCAEDRYCAIYWAIQYRDCLQTNCYRECYP